MKPTTFAAILFSILMMALPWNSQAVVINNPDGSKVWFNTCPPGETCPMSHSDSVMVNLLQQLLDAYDMNLIDSNGTYYIGAGAETIALNMSPGSPVTINIDSAHLSVNLSDTFNIRKYNDSTFTWITTDSITLNPLTYKSITYSVLDGTATVRIGSRTTSGIPTGYSASFVSDGMLIERFRFISSSGKIIVNAIK